MLSKYTLIAFSFVLSTVSATAKEIRSEPESPNKSLVFEVLTLLQEHVITKEQVDWKMLNSGVTNMLGHSPSLELTHQTIYYILKEVKTNHSFYRFKESGSVIMHSEFSCRVKITDKYELPEDVGYVRIDAFPNATMNNPVEFANAVHTQIAKQDVKELKGWIVDLRRNSGGNMWPMLAGVSALLGDGTKGYFVKPDGDKTQWGTYQGASFLNNRFQIRVDNPYQLNNINKPIAILSSKRTSSSGEAMLIAFKGMDNTRLFGKDSCGMSTANRGFTLQNGDTLLITTATMEDRRGQAYPAGVEVDDESETPLFSATKWIYSQSSE